MRITSATQLAQSVNLNDVLGAALIIIGLIINLGCILYGARLVLQRFQPIINDETEDDLYIDEDQYKRDRHRNIEMYFDERIQRKSLKEA